ncbi:biotin/lipoyl-containing protein [Roseinatronobacter bogoriensis]|uniref:Pyruvate dehydrogenase n=1 Tax=Roseinatronobacter bogoriensis subsp. barguzinensis TaxID=441209 RepID=A0A2K8K7G5_9RHOB|nr:MULTISPECIES: biotin/lipoyl-containing protein [Rhodobaca]ATX64856.1 pyruvate dehydrogenase [Rhodobaca barguzinensis]MBB4208650.1 pyruvate dehydrogenase E2 component (dihydrolipoamide acetyltransferase)/2-oxoglutarate dehydrogenase E2 component (dihydrolipoamide succinyltransferase) [Rhodobaca bogoriensis DSM 18756]TDW38082.1 pyruvate dehydrogenase E2 component (dihydrolipoamide acetyltransferase)/2-oxoglutarate dehydrogenase E2 component (dihydrolipoamide succinyltransferase) [Rhodobaca barg
MPHEVTMPQLGMAQDAGKIVSWLKAPGDKVAKGDALFEVETDKATMEVEAQASGFLTHVTAREGEDVPVGQAIARISDSADAADAGPEGRTATESPAPDTLPEGREITMPQLGMAQDSGVLVGWLVELGAKVGADDLLFEVETDKATMEVPAGVGGYLAATLAQAGDTVPVGHAVAVISASKPDAPVARGLVAAGPMPDAAPPSEATKEDTSIANPTPPAQAATAPAPQPTGGRILASPKLRRVALEKGLDLARLVQAGHPQPYHMRDLEVLKNLPTQASAPQAAMSVQTIRLEAECAQDGFAPFAIWAAGARGLSDADALLAGLAGASLGRAATVAIDRFGASRAYNVPAGRNLSAVAPSDAAPDLRVRDLRMSALSALSLGAEAIPVLTLLPKGAGLALVMECAPDQLAPDQAIALLSEFAGRMRDPLRHLL